MVTNGQQDPERISSLPHAPQILLDLISPCAKIVPSLMMERLRKIKWTTVRGACVSYQLFVRDNVYICIVMLGIVYRHSVMKKQSSVLHSVPIYFLPAQIIKTVTTCSRPSSISVYQQYSLVMCSNSLFSVEKSSLSILGETTWGRFSRSKQSDSHILYRHHA